jgi:hypothetical protein
MGVFKTVGQNQAKTMSGNLVTSGGEQERSHARSEKQGEGQNAENKNEVVKSVLESFEKTQQKRN